MKLNENFAKYGFDTYNFFENQFFSSCLSFFMLELKTTILGQVWIFID